MARKEFAATLTSSAVARSVTSRGVPVGRAPRRRPRRGVRRPARPRRRPARRRRGGRGAGCPRPRSPRAGTPGSRAAWRPGRVLAMPLGEPLGGARPGRSTCRRRRRRGSGAAAGRRPRRRRSAGRRRSRPAAAGCRRRRSARRRRRPRRRRW